VLVGAIPIATFAEETPETYTYDAGNSRWNSNKWVYDPATKVYVPAVPEGATKPKPAPETNADNGDEDPDAKALQSANPAGGSATVGQNVNGTSDTTVKTDASIKNGIDSNAGTGNAGVKSNTKAGDALSGHADADTTLINSIHTTVDGETEGVAHFTTNIYGDVFGDITLGPSIANAQVDRNINLNSNMDVNTSGSITNDAKVRAISGDAEVSKNTEAGSAKSGNANAVANVLNLINTVIGANKSFIGTINIYGNLNGDILVSPEFIPQLLADNSIERTQIDMPLSMNLNDDSQIVNNVKLNATSGDASVRDNTGAGSATTGEAKTKLTVLNLTGRKVNAKNSLLVFVNVLGEWVGMIVDAPNATAAAIGSGVTNNTVNVSDNTNINNKSKIVNNLDIGAESGDASVTQNTKGGDATSGDATASANIANIETSEFQLTDWFGVVFINVFGKWIGSFGIDTEAGTVVPLTGNAVPTQPGSPNMRFGFNPKTDNQAQISALATGTSDGGTSRAGAAAAALLASTGGNIPGAPSVLRPIASPREDPFSTIMMVTGFTAAGISGAVWALRRRAELREAMATTPGLSIPNTH
jgi:hypothetical protein